MSAAVTISRRAGLISALALSTAQAQPRAREPLLTGVNLAGLEFRSSRLPGRVDHDFVAPTAGELDYYKSRGAKVVRVPFLWERLQPELGGAFDTAYWTLIQQLIDAAGERRMKIILDPHQFGRRSSAIIGENDEASADQFAAFWRELAARCRAREHVIFNLQNEPHDQDGARLARMNGHLLRTIRETGARQLILVPGGSWSGAHSWVSSGNAAAMERLDDPNFAFDIHQYLDSDSSGLHRECIAGASQRLRAFTEWARAHGRRGFLGEFGVSDDAGCITELTAMLHYVAANRDVWIGWTYWAGGPWWPDEYFLKVEPDSLEQPQDRAQMAVLRRYFE